MLLSCIDTTQKIDIVISYNSKDITFSVDVLDNKNGVLILDLITHNDKILNFENTPAKITVLAKSKDSELYVFSDCLFKNVYLKENRYMVVTTKTPGVKFNRRTEFRMFVGGTGVVKYNRDANSLNVIVKDISISGFSFTTINAIIPEDVVNVSLLFENKYYEKVKIQGKIVRRFSLENESMVYGCKVLVSSHDLSSYICCVQREKVKKKINT